MPELFIYKGFRFFFYSNDHPYHCHVKKAGKEIRVRFNKSGLINPIIQHLSKKKFNPNELKQIIQAVVSQRDQMVKDWDNFRIGIKPLKRTIHGTKKKTKAKSDTQNKEIYEEKKAL